MRIYRNYLHHCLLLVAVLCGSVHAEDIDIFAGTREVNTDLPNVIFVLDNSANWSRQSEGWGDGLRQGAAEVQAIKAALAPLTGQLNVGIVEYNTVGNSAENDGAYVRYDLQALNPANHEVLDDLLDTMASDVTVPEEKRNRGNPYGYLLSDVYNYLSDSRQSKGGEGTPGNLADTEAYRTEWDEFRTPLTDVDACVDTYVIFVGNNVQGTVTPDDITNTNALKALYAGLDKTAPDALYGDSSGLPIPVPEFVTTVDKTIVGTSEMCWKESELSDCTAAEASSGGLCEGEVLCSCFEKAANQTDCKGTGNPDKRTYRWNVGAITTEVEASDRYDTEFGRSRNFDDWSKFLHNQGIPLDVVVDGETYHQRVKVTTYVIDVFNKLRKAELSQLWFSTAIVGGGRYFEARSEQAFLDAINATLGEILAVSSSFAAVTLPLSANNSSQRDNEIYIGMFRPAPGKSPRWFGNLKRYQIATFNGVPALADVNLRRAINPLTGFSRDCAESFWSYDSGPYWENLGIDPSMASACTEAVDAGQEWSDLPDGPFVEKGAVAQVTRLDPAGVGRTLYTVKPTTSGLGPVVNTDVGGQALFDYLRGDSPGVGEVMARDEFGEVIGLRPSVHGDVVHSRPLAIRYDDDTVLVYYGTNDGLFRAVNTDNGQEEWAFLAPEHFAKIKRLYDNTRLVAYEGATQDDGSTYSPKDYFFDGTTGLLVKYEDPIDPDSEALGALDIAYIYPTMRRGGRMVYGFDVTDPDAPSLLWGLGCPNLDNDTDCSTGFTNIGQTWSTPVGVYAAEYFGSSGTDPAPIVIFGGGFDECLNIDEAAYPTECSSAKGKGIYVLDAVTGDLLEHFPTDAPVITQVSPIDIDFDGFVDLVYAADVAGNLYRITKADLTQDLTGLSDVPVGAIAPRDNTDDDKWEIEKIASIPGTTQRFYNSPTVGLFQGTILVTIGSGDRERPLEVNYPYRDKVQNSFYVLADSPYKDWLAKQTDEDYTPEVVDLEGDTMFLVGSDLEDGQDLRSFDGWYMDLPDRGEQVSDPSAIGGGQVLFSTFQPGGVSTGICAEPLGIGKNYAMKLFSPEGTEGEECAGGGFCIPPVIEIVQNIYEGCEDGEDCPPPPPCPEGQPNCVPPPPPPCPEGQPNCKDPNVPKTLTICIIGGFDVCKLDPDVDPTRRRTFFVEDIDRSIP